MAIDQQTRPRPRSAAPAEPGRRGLSRVPGEIAGYALIAIGLAALLWSRIEDVDAFYLDEWFYVHGSQYIWEQFPAGLVEAIPHWNRGPQRLYSTLLAPLWGPLPTSTAYTLSHMLNVLLLTSAIVPTALLARRVIDVPALRVLAVALGTVVPWLMIGSHLLTENLAFPLYMWTVYAIVRCAEEPSLAWQAAALGAIAGLTLSRLNLAFVVGVLFVAVAVAEWMRRRDERDVPIRPWLRGALRREALVVVAAALAAVAAVVLAVRGGSGVSSHYGGLDFGTATERLFGEGAGETWNTMLRYLRGLVTGGFVFPMAIGLGFALAGVAGRLGRRLVIPSLVALLGLATVVVVVSTSTVGGAIEERYVMYLYTPIAVIAVAGLAAAGRTLWWLVAGSALALFVLAEGAPAPAENGGNFFAAPAGAFWTRVLHDRLVGWEEDLLGWLPFSATGWLLFAAALAGMLIFVGLAARRGRPGLIAPVLAGGLALCAVGQALVLDYGFKQELYGTVDYPGGIAMSPDTQPDRETWLDDRLPSERSVAVMPGVASFSARWGGTEVLQFWNRVGDSTVALSWNGSVTPLPPGYEQVSTRLGEDGLARWQPRPDWVAAHRDDPRVQFAGRLVARSPVSPYGLYRTARSDRALWTATGLEPDGAVLEDRPVRMSLDRQAESATGSVAVALRAAEGAVEPVRWRVTRDGRRVASGRLRPGQSRSLRLAAPACSAGERCSALRWTLRASGPPVEIPLPVYGPPGPSRPVTMMVVSARVGRDG